MFFTSLFALMKALFLRLGVGHVVSCRIGPSCDWRLARGRRYRGPHIASRSMRLTHLNAYARNIGLGRRDHSCAIGIELQANQPHRQHAPPVAARPMGLAAPVLIPRPRTRPLSAGALGE